MTRLIGLTITALLIVSIFLLAVAAALVASEPGTRWLLDRLSALSPVQIEIKGVRGRLLTQLTVDRLIVTTDTTRLQADNVLFDADWSASFWDDRIAADALRIGRLAIRTRPNDTPTAERVVVLPPLPVDLVVAALDVKKIEVNDVDTALLPAVAGAVTWIDGELKIAGLRAVAARYRVEGDAIATAESGVTVDATLAVHATLPVDGVDTEFDGNVALSGPLENVNVEARISAPWPIEINGRVEALHAEPFIALDIDGRDVQWRDYRLPVLEAHVEGTRLEYGGHLTAEATTPFRVHGTVSGPFNGDTRSVRSDALVLDTNAGRANGNLAIEWKPELAFTFAAHVADAPLSLWNESLHGEVSGDVSGALTNAVFSAQLADLVGTFEGHPWAGTGSLEYRDGVLTATNVVMTAGTDRAAGSGRWQEGAMSAAAEFDIGTLQRFLPTVTGDAKGRASVEYADGRWSGSGRVTSRSVAYEGYELHDIAIDAERNPAHNRLKATAALARARALELDTVEIVATGPDQRIDVRTAWHAREGNSQVSAVVRLGDSRTDITLADSTRLALPGGVWQLADAARLRLEGANVEASPHCWKMQDASLCVATLRRQDTAIDSSGSLKGLPLGAFGWLSSAVDGFNGDIGGEWAVAQRDGQWRGSGRIAIQHVYFDPSEEDGDEVALPEVRSSFTLDQRGAHASLSAGAVESPVVIGELKLGGFDASARLDGALRFELDDLAWVSTLSDRMSKTRGRLEGQLVFDGTVGAPNGSGKVRLEDGALEWQEPHVELGSINVDLELVDADRVSIAGTAQARDGKMTVKGGIERLLSDERRLHLTLTSETVSVALPDMLIAVTPELELDWTNDDLRLTGQVRVPSAKIKISRLPEGATAVSEDVVVVGREVSAPPRTRLATDLRVILGDDVNLTAFGLETRLKGNLRLQQPKNGAVSLNGRIDLVGGQYSAYGRSLAIDSGRLIFQGPPDDPDVDVRAVRRIERPEPEGPITVGVHVRGRATALESTMFSEPPMAESDALSYLVMGRPLQQTTESEGEDLSGVAVALGLAQATGVVNQIRTRVGLDELGAGSSAAQETTVFAAKQLGQKLYARYTYNTFTRLSALLLRYDLTRRLSLEATAGEAPGMDVIYRVGSD